MPLQICHPQGQPNKIICSYNHNTATSYPERLQEMRCLKEKNHCLELEVKQNRFQKQQTQKQNYIMANKSTPICTHLDLQSDEAQQIHLRLKTLFCQEYIQNSQPAKHQNFAQPTSNVPKHFSLTQSLFSSKCQKSHVMYYMLKLLNVRNRMCIWVHFHTITEQMLWKSSHCKSVTICTEEENRYRRQREFVD